MIVPSIIPFVVMLSLLVINRLIVKKWKSLSVFILGIYTFSAAAFFILSNTWVYSYYHCSVDTILHVAIVLSVMLMPLAFFERRTPVLSFSKIDENKLKKMSMVVILLGVYSIIFFAQYIVRVFVTGVVATRSAEGGFAFSASLFSKLACWGAFLSPIALYFYFYNKTVHVLSERQSRWLFLSSLSFVIYTLNVAGRDGIVIWALCFTALYFLFSNHILAEERKSLLKTAGLLFFGGFFLLWFISAERFASSDAGTSFSMLSYFSQSWENLTRNIEISKATDIHNIAPYSQFELLTMFFPSLREGNEYFAGVDNLSQTLWSMGFRSKQFAFFIGSFVPHYSNYIIFSAFIFICFLVYKTNLKVTSDGCVNSARLLTAFSWYMIPIVGIFYYYYGSVAGNVYLLTPFVISWYLRKK